MLHVCYERTFFNTLENAFSSIISGLFYFFFILAALTRLHVIQL
nr:MAG TPA: hypothetical protein [Caudoviricetes sp.]